MEITRKYSHVSITHSDEFRGNVTIFKGCVSITMSIDDLRAFVAESVRYEAALALQGMKPAQLLRRLT